MPKKHELTFSELLYKERISRGLTLRAAAARIGIHHARLDELEKGVDNRSGRPASPSYETVVRIAQAYDIPVDELLRLAGYEPGLGLSSDERTLLDLYRLATLKSREAAIDILRKSAES